MTELANIELAHDSRAPEEARCEQIFVFSLPRSGSTLLRVLLDTHPAICCPGELELGQLCNNLYRAIYYTLGQVANPSEEERVVRAHGEVRRVVNEFMGSYASGKGKTIWAEKAPTNLAHAELLWRAFPNALHICLHRQPLDVLRSAWEAMQYGRIDYELWDYESHCRSYIQQTRELLRFEKDHPSVTCRVYYENLVERPIDTLTVLCGFLGLEWDPSIVENVFRAKHDDGPGDPKVAFSTRIYTDSIGKGREIVPQVMKLPQKLRDEINELASELGYASVDSVRDENTLCTSASSSPTLRNGVCSSVNELFTSYLPSKLKRAKLEHNNLKGSAKFFVKGEGGGTWTIDLNVEPAFIAPVDAAADCTITIRAADLLKITSGELNIGDCFLQARLRVTGNESLAIFLGRTLLT